jgi:hypothetical protein
LIEDVLLKRTEVLCEQDKLQTSRDFLKSSLDQIISVIDNQMIGNCTSAMDMVFGCTEARMRTENQATCPGCLDSGILLDSSFIAAAECGQGIPPLERTSVPTTTAVDIHDRYDNYKNDCIHLKEQEVAFKSLTRDLSNLEYRLQGALETFRTSLRSPALTQGTEHDIVNAPPGSALSITSTESSEDIPPVLEEYYCCRGNVGIYQERLQELDFYHDEGLVERHFLRENGRALEISDGEFDRNYRNRRLAIEKDLSAAQADVDTLAERCRDAGISMGDAADDSNDSVSMVSASEFRVIEAGSATTPEPTPRRSRTSEVIQWIGNVIGRHKKDG